MYSILCWVEADLSHLPKTPKYSTYIHDLYYEIEYDVILSLGLTEFNAFIAWREKVLLIRIPACVLTDHISLNIERREKARYQNVIHMSLHSSLSFRTPAQIVYDPDRIVDDST